MSEIPNDQAGSIADRKRPEASAAQPSNQSDHAEPTEQPDEADEPQAGSPS